MRALTSSAASCTNVVHDNRHRLPVEYKTTEPCCCFAESAAGEEQRRVLAGTTASSPARPHSRAPVLLPPPPPSPPDGALLRRLEPVRAAARCLHLDGAAREQAPAGEGDLHRRGVLEAVSCFSIHAYQLLLAALIAIERTGTAAPRQGGSLYASE